jgi:hypothetical protein
MMSPWKSVLLCGSTALAFSAAAIAQTAPPSPAGTAPPPAMGQAPFYDPQQLPAYRGQVQQLTLTPRGDIDGLILSDGTEVKTPPHLSTQLAYSLKPGDTVTVHGLRAAALPLVQAVSITDEASGQTVIDNGLLVQDVARARRRRPWGRPPSAPFRPLRPRRCLD